MDIHFVHKDNFRFNSSAKNCFSTTEAQIIIEEIPFKHVINAWKHSNEYGMSNL